MNVLAIGDVVGSRGCEFLKEKLPKIKTDYKVDLTIANGENSAEGNGITIASAEFLLLAVAQGYQAREVMIVF